MNTKALFRKWLFQQAGTNTPLGDLASDLRDDPDLPFDVVDFMDFVGYVLKMDCDSFVEILLVGFVLYCQDCPDSRKAPKYSEGRSRKARDIELDMECPACGRPIHTIRDAVLEWEISNGELQMVLVHSSENLDMNPCSQLSSHMSFSQVVFPNWVLSKPIEVILTDSLIGKLPTSEVYRSAFWVIKLCAILRDSLKERIAARPVPSSSITPSKRFDILLRDGFKCCLCGKGAAQNAVLEIDHKHPRSLGGTNEDENLWTLCFECNRGKCAKVVDFQEAGHCDSETKDGGR